MKSPAFVLLVLVLALSVEVRAQGQESNNTVSSNNSCERYKIGIITPRKDIDFKITIIVPPKNIDQAMVINPCPAEVQIASTSGRHIPLFAPQTMIPSEEPNAFFKAPSFTITNKYSR
ncbi:MAG TPA: hypothetical protein VM911_11535 [Pyrinomonadaceae bacterium]|jgi:hypothetical protein|nr:hypothetical protein [Pyrinomonadaceae bacterium]